MKKFFIPVLLFSLFLSCDKMPLEPPDVKIPSENQNENTSATATTITFARNFGGPDWDLGKSVITTYDGGYALLVCNGSLTGRFLLIKTDQYGIKQWEKIYEEPGHIYASEQLLQTEDSGFILTGSDNLVESAIPCYAKVIKTDKYGGIQWQTWFGDINTTGKSIALSHDGGYVGAGWNEGRASVYKINSTGNLLWINQYVKDSYSRAHSIERTSDNGFIIAGYSINSQNNFDLYLLKITSEGTMQWQTTWGKQGYDIGYHAIQTSDGGYALIGSKTIDTNTSKREIYLVKTNSQGKYVWIKGYQPNFNVDGIKIRETADLGFVIAETRTLLKVSSNGSFQWRKKYSTAILLGLSDVIIAADGGYAIAGYVQIGSQMQASLVKVNRNGNF